MTEPTLGSTLAQLFESFFLLLGLVIRYLLPWTLLIIWIVWWLLAVNWKRCGAALRAGGWAPVVLLGLVAALVWSRFQPVGCSCPGFVVIPNFWWQLGYVALLIALALFCGWLQGVLHWVPAELDLTPPVQGFEHVHDESLHVHTENVPHDAHGHH
jgi:hypothetical protein